MYNIIIKNSAKKELDAIPADQFLKIDAAILALKTNLHPHPQSNRISTMQNLTEENIAIVGVKG